MKTVAVLGAGTAGTAMAHVLASNGSDVRLWGIEAAALNEIGERRRNSKYLPGLELHPRIQAKPDLAEALAGAWLVLFSVPTQAIRSLAQKAAPYLGPEQTLLSVAKGLEVESRLRMSQVLAQVLPEGLHDRIAAMGGPVIAIELVQGTPTAVVVGAPDIALAQAIREALENDHFKVETTTDICGVELGATLKNIYAIILGMCDGSGYRTNTKSFLGSVAMAEMARLGDALGSQRQTLYSLAGLGDLLTTGFSPHSRNRTFGEKLIGEDWRQYLDTHTVEGVSACQAVRELARAQGVEAPLLDAVYGVLFQGEPAAATLGRLLRDFSF
ncbi:MAG: NAD(P)H-dependent glycerol-3-phosphate dehydrogenase [Dehalococcoidia bacterium]